MDRRWSVLLVDCTPIGSLSHYPRFYGYCPSGSSQVLWTTFFMGLLWGIGGLTYGLGVRYLGVSLGGVPSSSDYAPSSGHWCLPFIIISTQKREKIRYQISLELPGDEWFYSAFSLYCGHRDLW